MQCVKRFIVRNFGVLVSRRTHMKVGSERDVWIQVSQHLKISVQNGTKLKIEKQKLIGESFLQKV